MFVYFKYKTEIYGRHKKLTGQMNEKRLPNVTERLPARNLEVEKTSNQQGLITTNKNCQVRVLIGGFNGSIHSQVVDGFVAINHMPDSAVPREERNVEGEETDNILDQRKFPSFFIIKSQNYDGQNKTTKQKGLNGEYSPIDSAMNLK